MADCRYVTDYPALVRHRREEREAARSRHRRLVVAVPVVTVVAFAASYVGLPLALLVAMIGAGVVFFLALPGASSVPPGDLAGVEGEIAALDRLRAMPDDFRIFNRVQLPDVELPGGRRELDFIVTGPTGLWVVEVKNTPGLVHVLPERRHWPLARRAGCGSSPSWNAVENPVPQIQAQVRALRRWLLQQGVAAEPEGIVCFANPEVALRDAQASPVPVLVREQLDGFIRGWQGQAEVAPAADALAALVGSPSGRTPRAA
ncbi:MAG: nuclease-related domain-containing protein [Candidatus Wenzhouxiangella sp. M2_3B_020]